LSVLPLVQLVRPGDATQIPSVHVSFLIMAAGFFGLVGAFVYFRPEARARRELRRATLYRIADLPDGVRGRIAGRAYPLMQPIIAPLSGRECVYFIARVEQRTQNDDGSDSWGPVVNESRGVPFGIQDSSGRAIIDATDARIALEFDGSSRMRAFGDKTEVERAFLARHGMVSIMARGDLRYSEAIIGVDEVVAVLGAGVREPDPDASPTGGYRGEMPTRLRLTSSAAHPLVISDAPSVAR
jgi:hypothetical protein